MAVYVDQLFQTTPKTNWPYKWACHMFADEEAELHAFAQAIGLRRGWFQNHHPNPKFYHYDLTPGMRARAIKQGAVSIAWEEYAQRIGLINRPCKTPDCSAPGSVQCPDCKGWYCAECAETFLDFVPNRPEWVARGAKLPAAICANCHYQKYWFPALERDKAI